MKVLITGGAGFVGSHLTEYYLKKGDSVYIIDDLSTGSISNIQHLLDDENLKETEIHNGITQPSSQKNSWI